MLFDLLYVLRIGLNTSTFDNITVKVVIFSTIFGFIYHWVFDINVLTIFSFYLNFM